MTVLHKVHLVGGPHDGETIHTDTIGRRLIVPDVQFCTLQGCMVMHPITHEYTIRMDDTAHLYGDWHSSYSALRPSRDA